LRSVEDFPAGIPFLIDLQRLVDEEHARGWNVRHLIEVIADGDEILFVNGEYRRGVGNGHDEFSLRKMPRCLGALGEIIEHLVQQATANDPSLCE
jgi:hypothetical protein